VNFTFTGVAAAAAGFSTTSSGSSSSSACSFARFFLRAFRPQKQPPQQIGVLQLLQCSPQAPLDGDY
jgi:hypothetical protein